MRRKQILKYPSFSTSLVLFASLVLLVGCSGKQDLASYNTNLNLSGNGYKTEPASPSSIGRSVLNQISVFYDDWKETPYRYSGSSIDGIDCSSLAQKLYKDLFAYQLPRTVDGQMKIGKPIAANQLRPGDLIFFRTGPRTKHVGIYVKAGTFIHASSSEGVKISALNNGYWNKRFISARTLYKNAKSRPLRR